MTACVREIHMFNRNTTEFDRWASGLASTAIGSWGLRRGGLFGLLAIAGAGVLAWRASAHRQEILAVANKFSPIALLPDSKPRRARKSAPRKAADAVTAAAKPVARKAAAKVKSAARTVEKTVEKAAPAKVSAKPAAKPATKRAASASKAPRKAPARTPETTETGSAVTH